ncbi:sigma-54 dependent transcriptional regulator [Pseudothauera rhizosphaerae]|uniref:Sigma-54-dependent Fis family transcriptional regulator n=1 Tax=Pseudothauera rhizosphaerae TaxID=2565932 RepID=A0A4S4AV14_9RHOO|nr:sigma-54 dependent transcriptional regulator [Pseudothauera rhizosphaerae]THF63380.1 sigma-54-dependent Fis family transcriptional regulator [Pseudothauera rhizosphaerae]
MSKRKGLLLDQQGTVSAALHDLELPEWEFLTLTTLDAARRALSGKVPLVGLVVFDSARDWPVRELEALIARHPIEWIAILGRGLMRDTQLAPLVARNFHDFHTLPLDRERLLITLGHAHGKALITRAASGTAQECGRFGMTGNSPRMLELYRQIEKIVTVDAPVLIGGESGSGKELVARAIHSHSERARGPFIAMNCGAIPPNLIQSELFGHERGAFSGAHQRKIGNIEAANDGVLFLDEIGDLPLDLQANLLRFLQERTIVRVGSTERVRVNVRVIAATHVDLNRAVAEGRFREDLYYRLNVVHLKVPALRERPGDIPPLADGIFAEHSHQKAPQVKGFSSEALRAMQEYAWPGNVRELTNRIQQAMIMSENRLITVADLGLPIGEGAADARTLDEARATVEKEIIVSNLRKYRNNVSEVARQLGVSRVTLYRMIDRLNIVL